MPEPQYNPLQYMQQLQQQPFSGSNLPAILRQLSRQGSSMSPATVQAAAAQVQNEDSMGAQAAQQGTGYMPLQQSTAMGTDASQGQDLSLGANQGQGTGGY